MGRRGAEQACQALPSLQEEWEEEFARYKLTPEYIKTNQVRCGRPRPVLRPTTLLFRTAGRCVSSDVACRPVQPAGGRRSAPHSSLDGAACPGPHPLRPAAAAP